MEKFTTLEPTVPQKIIGASDSKAAAHPKILKLPFFALDSLDFSRKFSPQSSNSLDFDRKLGSHGDLSGMIPKKVTKVHDEAPIDLAEIFKTFDNLKKTLPTIDPALQNTALLPTSFGNSLPFSGINGKTFPTGSFPIFTLPPLTPTLNE